MFGFREKLTSKKRLNGFELRLLMYYVSLAYVPTLLNPVNWFNRPRRERCLVYYGSRLAGYSRQNAVLLTKQSNLETGFQQLGFYAQGTNNLFGMHRPSKRQTINSGAVHNEAEGGQMLVFSSVVQSIVDRMLWDNFHQIPRSSANYMERVQQKNYNPKDSYIQAVENTNLALASSPETFLRVFYIILLLILLILGRVVYKKVV